eukprot:8425-Hanusia_phi.AAC.1
MHDSAARHLEDRITRAIRLCKEEMGLSDLRHLVVCGGVAANKPEASTSPPCSRLLGSAQVHLPCRARAANSATDNGVMVAWAAVERLRMGVCEDPAELEVRARWPLGVSQTFPHEKPTSAKHTKLPHTTSPSAS